MDAEFDILIIGSGAGGGTVASALAPLCAEGARIAVLEWGPHFNDDEFTGRELEMAEKLFFDSGAIGNRDQTLNVACARGYGGSTLAYTGTSIEIPARSLERCRSRPDARRSRAAHAALQAAEQRPRAA